MKRTSSAWKQVSTRGIQKRSGFTLVELLVVITIIGILVGLTLAGVNAARLAIQRGAAKYEIQQLDAAVQAYRSQYGDYPPDGSSWPIMEAHLRKAFPEILQTELNLLSPYMSAGNAYIRNDNDPSASRVFDPAESLVFFLGGFSSDKQRPFTGKGGPLIANPASPGSWMYNLQRDNAFYEFKANRLTAVTDAAGSHSTDESSYGVGANDLMPVYLCYGHTTATGGVPIVYFDQRTYQITSPAGTYFNFYTPGVAASSVNCARPYLADQSNALLLAHASAPDSADARPKLYANAKTFQIVSAGADKLYGSRSVSSATSSGLVLFTAPGGVACTPLVDAATGTTQFYKTSGPTITKYLLTEFGTANPALDNVSNFTEGNIFSESR